MIIIFYRVYAFVGFVLLLNAISTAFFSKKNWKNKAIIVVSAILMSLVWPVALFSPQGRKILLTKTLKL